MDQFIVSQAKPDPAPQENNPPQQVPTNPPTEPPPSYNPAGNASPSNQPQANEPQVQTIGEPPQKNAKRSGRFRAIFLILLLITMFSAGATTFIILNWSRSTETTSNAQIIIPTPTLKGLENTEVEVNPFSNEALNDNPFNESTTDSANIFNEFEESTGSGQEYQNPF